MAMHFSSIDFWLLYSYVVQIANNDDMTHTDTPSKSIVISNNEIINKNNWCHEAKHQRQSNSSTAQHAHLYILIDLLIMILLYRLYYEWSGMACSIIDEITLIIFKPFNCQFHNEKFTNEEIVYLKCAINRFVSEMPALRWHIQ